MGTAVTGKCAHVIYRSLQHHEIPGPHYTDTHTYIHTYIHTSYTHIWLTFYVLGIFVFIDTIQSSSKNWQSLFRVRSVLPFQDSVKFVQTSCRISVPGTSSESEQKVPSNFLRDKKLIPESDPPSIEDIKFLYQFFDSRFLLDVLIYGFITEIKIVQQLFVNDTSFKIKYILFLLNFNNIDEEVLLY